MADKRIGELPAAPGVYDDTLFVAEQQGAAVKITAGQLRGSPSSSGGDIGLSLYAPKADPVFTGSISLARTPGVGIGWNSVAMGGEVQAPGDFSTAFGAYSKIE